jgi:predicted amidophosphoribosyltransferase
MRCPRCGIDIKTAGKFCLNCGENISYVNIDHRTPSPSSLPESSSRGQSPEIYDIERCNKELERLLLEQKIESDEFVKHTRERLPTLTPQIMKMPAN